MRTRILFAAFAASLITLVGTPVTAHASTVQSARHSCTRNSSHNCIKGGQFCAQSKYGHSGWDAQGRRYVCKGSHSHPHWMKP